MSKLTATLKEEFLKLLPPTIFFFVALQVVSLMRSLMLKGTGISLDASISIAVAALILGKAVLLADMLPFVNRFAGRPLAYGVVWTTTIYALVATLLHYLERLVDFWRKAGGFIAGNESMLAKMIWPHFWATQILLVVLVLAFCTAREVIRAIGEDEVRRMFFGPLPSGGV
jgi:hypothetical protein